MKNNLKCPICNKELIEFESFFACSELHEHQRCIGGNLILSKDASSELTVNEAYDVVKLKSKLGFARQFNIFLDPQSDIESILIYGFNNSDIAEYLSTVYPNARIYISVSSNKELKNLRSEANYLFLICDDDLFEKYSFDLIFADMGRKIDVDLMKKDGRLISISYGEDSCREIRYLGFTPPIESFKKKPYLSETKRLKLSKRVFLSAKEIKPLHKIIYGKRSELDISSYTETFISVSMIISIYEKD